ncbi:MAG: toprim domain-containing protein, partial [Fusobacteriaceae bacterium]
TALTEEQAKLLKRYTNNVILSFDMDAPGQKATEKAIMILKEESFSIRVVEINDAKDPDEYIKKFGRESFLEKIQNSIESFDFLYRLYSKEYNLNDILAKQNFIKRFKEFFQCIENRVEKSLYIDKLSQNIGVDKDILWDELVEDNKKKPKRKFEDKDSEINKKNLDSKKNILPKENEREALSIALILLDNKYFEYFKNKEYSSDFLKKILNYVENSLSKNKKVAASELINFSEFSDEEKDKMVEFFVHNGSYINTSAQEKLFITLMSDWLRDEIKEFKKKNSISFVENLELKKITERLKDDISSQEEILKLSNKFNKIYEAKFFEV